MKDLKAILEVGRNTKDNKISKNLSASLNIANMNNILFALAYTYKHDECFYGPQKIIAIKPKEIILADDGVSIETYNGSNNVKLNKNRVVVFNLFDNSISESYDAPEDFNFELSTSGYYPE